MQISGDPLPASIFINQVFPLKAKLQCLCSAQKADSCRDLPCHGSVVHKQHRILFASNKNVIFTSCILTNQCQHSYSRILKKRSAFQDLFYWPQTLYKTQETNNTKTRHVFFLVKLSLSHFCTKAKKAEKAFVTVLGSLDAHNHMQHSLFDLLQVSKLNNFSLIEVKCQVTVIWKAGFSEARQTKLAPEPSGCISMAMIALHMQSGVVLKKGRKIRSRVFCCWFLYLFRDHAVFNLYRTQVESARVDPRRPGLSTCEPKCDEKSQMFSKASSSPKSSRKKRAAGNNILSFFQHSFSCFQFLQQVSASADKDKPKQEQVGSICSNVFQLRTAVALKLQLHAKYGKITGFVVILQQWSSHSKCHDQAHSKSPKQSWPETESEFLFGLQENNTVTCGEITTHTTLKLSCVTSILQITQDRFCSWQPVICQDKRWLLWVFMARPVLSVRVGSDYKCTSSNFVCLKTAERESTLCTCGCPAGHRFPHYPATFHMHRFVWNTFIFPEISVTQNIQKLPSHIDIWGSNIHSFNYSKKALK